MPTVMEPSEVEEVVTGVQEEATPSHLTTTLYDLIAAIQEVVGVDDALVVATVAHLLRSGRLTFPGKARARLCQSRHEEDTGMAVGLPTSHSGAVPLSEMSVCRAVAAAP